MVADRGLRLAERLHQSARAHLGLSGDEAQEAQPAGGMGFRNYWFRPIKNVVEKLPKIYKGLKAKK